MTENHAVLSNDMVGADESPTDNAAMQLAALQAEERTWKEEMERREQELLMKEGKLNDLEQELLERENAVKESENSLNQRIRNTEGEIQRIRIDAKEKLEVELARERVRAVSSLNEQLSDERVSFDNNLAKLEKDRMASLERMLEEKRKDAEGEIEAKREQAAADIAEKIRLSDERIRVDIDERTKAVSEREDKMKELMSQYESRCSELEDQEEQLEQREAALQQEKRQVEREKRRITSRKEELAEQEAELIELIRHGMPEKTDSLYAQLSAKDEALKELRDRVSGLIAEQQAIETFKVSIGQDPAIIENRILNLNKTIDELKAELASRASGEIQKERDLYKRECDDLKISIADLEKKNKSLQQRNEELLHYETAGNGLEERNKDLESEVAELRSQKEVLRQRLERLSLAEERESDRDQRIAEINKGYLGKLIGANQNMNLTEIEWLNNIYNQCDSYGIHFPQRILYAFHTALKISDWSSVTILAGVSGTGKSELPKLYAAFGGINFISVPVQPSWDSQESMLVFFNSIDNRFEPEPLLKFLVQCTENDEYNKYMSIVLLDEMNLAHVEYYFADFLSKLETRRGTENVPSIEVKLGANVMPYQLKLERSILWTGTMNQDETTKSLSDKVLDRGLVINFPRPRTLISRKGMKNLDTTIVKSNRPMLTSNQWKSWIVKTVNLQGEQSDELDKYKTIVEDINNELEHVGRALGHRVWQSIEHYIVNYPTVIEAREKLLVEKKDEKTGETILDRNGRAVYVSEGMSDELRKAMHDAFEDQIVQKIMPKLRGVETRGRGKENLDRIEALLEEKGFERLKDDFEIACEQGYGQFIWSSAKYIEADDAEKIKVSDEGSTQRMT